MQGKFDERMFMSYEGFCRCVRIDLEHRLKNAEVKLQKVLKNNGMELYGLVINEKGQSNFQPVIYLEVYYDQYIKGMGLWQIEQIILDVYRMNKLPPCFRADFFLDWNKVKEKIVFKVINTERNREYLETVPHFYYLDMAVIFTCYMGITEMGLANIIIHDNHCEMWGVTPKDLWDAANKNTFQLLKPKAMTMAECFGLKDEALEENAVLNMMFGSYPIYILTNDKKVNGAVGILYKPVLRDFADRAGSDFYIFPSSINELILMPVKGNEDVRSLKQMVRDINDKEVAPEEVLSDNVYKYIRATGEVVILKGDSDE